MIWLGIPKDDLVLDSIFNQLKHAIIKAEIAHVVAQGKSVATSGLSKLADGTPVVVREDQPPGA